MPVTIQNSVISRMLIVDDDPSAREGYSYPVEELDIKPVLKHGPVTDVARFVLWRHLDVKRRSRLLRKPTGQDHIPEEAENGRQQSHWVAG